MNIGVHVSLQIMVKRVRLAVNVKSVAEALQDLLFERDEEFLMVMGFLSRKLTQACELRGTIEA